MDNLTEAFCRHLLLLSPDEARSQGAKMEVLVRSALVGQTRSVGTSMPVELSAFHDTFRLCARVEDDGNIDRRVARYAASVCAVRALADARQSELSHRHYALGVGFEGQRRIVAALALPDGGPFDARFIGALFAVIISCAVVEGLSAEQMNIALGLGGSAVTAAKGGHLPLCMAMAARNGLSMVALAKAGFRAPPDVLGCEDGLFDVYNPFRIAGNPGQAGRMDRTPSQINRLYGQDPG